MTSVAIVTGYASGLGYCLSEELLRNSWTVIGVARRSRAAALEAGYPDRVHAVAGSVAEDETAGRAFAKAAELGGARLVVNCAGVGCFELCPQSSAIWFDHVAECSRGHGWRGDMGYRSAGHAEPPLGGFLHEFSFVLLE